MNQVLGLFDGILGILRPAFFWVALVVAVLALIDWLVRTRRIAPFSALARFTRESIDPLFKPVERTVLRAGGNPQSAPWWTLVFTVVAGLVLLSLLDFVRAQVAYLAMASSGGPGLGVLLLRWTFQALRLALIVRVASSWFSVSPTSRWVRWAWQLTEPFLRPLRGLLPTIGMVDISPIVAWFLLSLLESVVLRAVW